MLPLDSEPILFELFEHIWAGLQSHPVSAALQREVILIAFLDALLDCVWFCARRIITHDRAATEQGDLGSPDRLAQWLVRTQWEEVWRSILSGSLRIKEPLLGSSVGKGLIRMASLSHSMWSIISCL